ncbi:MAG TPA: hypothetical protein VE093_22770, partial [Polyangiaceae bacterium]|nr:hypothetical protein [Polyangiaceae bacterium]
MIDKSRSKQLIERWKEAHPLAYELARLCSPAARIEPELLRAVRLALLPRAGAASEADLWLSPLVQFRT